MATVNDPNGNPQAVLDNGFALNYCAVLEMSAHAGDDGNAYTILVEADAGGSDIDFFYLKNTSDLTLRIYKIKAYTGTTDTQVQIKTGVTGTPSSGTAVVPVNALVGSGNLAECTCEQRDGDMALTGGNVFDKLFVDKDFVGEQVWDFPGEIALEENQALVFNAVTDPGADIHMTVYLYFHEAVQKP